MRRARRFRRELRLEERRNEKHVRRQLDGADFVVRSERRDFQSRRLHAVAELRIHFVVAEEFLVQNVGAANLREARAFQDADGGSARKLRRIGRAVRYGVT